MPNTFTHADITPNDRLLVAVHSGRYFYMCARLPAAGAMRWEPSGNPLLQQADCSSCTAAKVLPWSKRKDYAARLYASDQLIGYVELPVGGMIDNGLRGEAAGGASSWRNRGEAGVLLCGEALTVQNLAPPLGHAVHTDLE